MQPARAAMPDQPAPTVHPPSKNTGNPVVPAVVAPSLVPHSTEPPKTHDPALGQQHYLTGYQLAQQRKYREAITELNQAIRLQPDFAPAYNGRGYARFQLHNYAAAIRDLDRAISLDPQYANAYHIRSVVKKAMGNLKGAAADARRAEELAR